MICAVNHYSILFATTPQSITGFEEYQMRQFELFCGVIKLSEDYEKNVTGIRHHL